MEAQPRVEKVILLGDTSTGKSSFLKNYGSNFRTKASIPTSNFECLTAFNANPQKYLQLWDTPGRQKYRLMPMAIIGNYDYCLIFYDITSRHTYDVAKALVQNVFQRNSHIRMALIGNKLDLAMNNPMKREVQEAQAKSFSMTHGIFFSEYSFQDRADKLLQRFIEEPVAASSGTKLQQPADKQCSCV